MQQNKISFSLKMWKFLAHQKLFFSFTLCVVAITSRADQTVKSSVLHARPRLDNFNKVGNPIDSILGDEDASMSKTFDMLGGDGGSSFPNKRLYNTSIALTASMFTYYLPGQTEAGSVVDLVNQAVYGLFGVLAVSLIFIVPVLLTGVMYDPSQNRNLDDTENAWVTSPIMKLENVRRIFNEEFRDEIGLDFDKCLKKTICEAHRSPRNKKYGLLTLPFRMFYPANPEGTWSRALPSSPYLSAANEGAYSSKDCGKEFKCFFDTLDLSTFLIDWYRLTSDAEYVPKNSDFQ